MDYVDLFFLYKLLVNPNTNLVISEKCYTSLSYRQIQFNSKLRLYDSIYIKSSIDPKQLKMVYIPP